ncbi:MAG: flagellar basal body-associated FliL family protein [Thermogutta sp.]
MASAAENAGKKEQTDQQTAGHSTHHGAIRLKLAGFIVGLVAVEALAAYFILPGSTNAGPPSQESEKVAASADTPHQTAAPVSVPETQIDPTQGLGTPGSGTEVEVDLGEFSVTSYQPTTQTTLRIDFHLWGTVDQSLEKDFQAAWAKANNRVRDQILVIVRSAELSELTDAGLGLIKRKILEKVNHALGKPYLKSVVFSEFSFLEQ